MNGRYQDENLERDATRSRKFNQKNDANVTRCRSTRTKEFSENFMRALAK